MEGQAAEKGSRDLPSLHLCPTAIYGRPPPQAQWIQECLMFSLIIRHKGWGPCSQGGAWELGPRCGYVRVSMCNENTESVPIKN